MDMPKMVERMEELDEEIQALEKLLENGNLYKIPSPLYHTTHEFLSKHPELTSRIEQFGPTLKKYLQHTYSNRNEEIAKNRHVYTNKFHEWTRKVRKIEAANGEPEDEGFKEHKPISTILSSTTSNSFSTTNSGNPSSRISGSRRGATGLGGEYMVRSEEELNQVVLSLLEQDRDNPTTRWMSTLAAPQPMFKATSKYFLAKFVNNNGRIEIPLSTLSLSVLAQSSPNGKNFDNLFYLDPVTSNTILSDNGTISVWSEAEQMIFLEKYLLFPKNFGKIATYLPFKNVSDCVLFYYRNKKRLRLKQRLANYKKGFSINSLIGGGSESAAWSENGNSLTGTMSTQVSAFIGGKRGASNSGSTTMSHGSLTTTNSSTTSIGQKKGKPVGRPPRVNVAQIVGEVDEGDIDYAIDAISGAEEDF